MGVRILGINDVARIVRVEELAAQGCAAARNFSHG